MPPGDGTPRGRLPDARAARGRRLRARAAAVQPVDGRRRGHRRCGSSASLGIFPDGKTYALAFGAFFGLMELIPYVGPFLGALPPMLVALFQDPLDRGVGRRCCSSALQQIEGHVVAPQIFGHALRINPLLVIFALLFGGELYGIVGALRRAADRGGRCARRSSTCAATSCSSRGARPPPAAHRRAPARRAADADVPECGALRRAGSARMRRLRPEPAAAPTPTRRGERSPTGPT